MGPGNRQERGIAASGVVNARDLRRRTTPAEDVLWRALRDRRLDGLKFRRQHPVGPFVLDFCCPDCRLAIELDGAVHDEQTEQDEYRTSLLTANGYRVLRFRNDEVLTDLASILNRIRRGTARSEPGAMPSPEPQVETLPSTAHGRGVGGEGVSAP